MALSLFLWLRLVLEGQIKIFKVLLTVLSEVFGFLRVMLVLSSIECRVKLGHFCSISRLFEFASVMAYVGIMVVRFFACCIL